MRVTTSMGSNWEAGHWETRRLETRPAEIGAPQHRDNLGKLNQIMTDRRANVGRSPLDKVAEAFDLYRDLIARRGDLPQVDTRLARAAIDACGDPAQSTDRNHAANRAAVEAIKDFRGRAAGRVGQQPAPGARGQS